MKFLSFTISNTILGFFFLLAFTLSRPSNVWSTEACDNISAEWSKIKDTIDRWEKNPLDFLPTPPPVVHYECRGHSRYQARDLRENAELRAYHEETYKNEKDLSTNAVKVAPLAISCGLTNPEDASALEKRAANIIGTRAITQMNQIKAFPGEGKFAYYRGAIAGAEGAWKAVETMGEPTNTIEEKREEMLQGLLDHLGQKVKRDHNLQITPTAFIEILDTAVRSGLATSERANEILERIFKFYRFKIDYRHETRLGDPTEGLQFNWNGVNASQFVKLDFVEVPVFGDRVKIEIKYRPSEMAVKVTGSGIVEDGSLSYIGYESYLSDLNSDFFPCDDTPIAAISLSSFGPTRDLWKMCSEDFCTNLPPFATSDTIGVSVFRQTPKVIKALWPEAKYSSITPKLAFTFLPELKNNVTEVVNYTEKGEVSGSEGLMESQIWLKITHEPQ